MGGRLHLPPRPALHGRERAHLHAPGRAAADLRLGVRRRSPSTSRCASATGSSPPSRTPSTCRSGRRRRAPTSRRRPATRSASRRPRTRASQIAHRLWAQHRPARRAVAGAAVAQALRAGQRARHRGHDARVDGVRQGRRQRTSRRSGRTPMPASTTSTSPTWARTTASSSTLYRDEVLPRVRLTPAVSRRARSASPRRAPRHRPARR